jgi:polysaccharide chain length determinant protein (PEP-CTERM system associated)
MIENRELTLDDYLAMLRRRAKIILVPALFAPLAGFLVSYMFPPKFSSQSLVLVEGQKVPDTMVQPVVTEDLTSRIATVEQRALSENHLKTLAENLQLVKPGQNADDVIDGIRSGISVEPVITDLSSVTTNTGKKKPNQSGAVPGFYVGFTAPNARTARDICEGVTSLMLEENLKLISDAAKGTADVLSSGLDSAQRDLNDMDSKLATFKKQYVGQLPTDSENNLKILMGLNSQLESNTQTLNRAQQDKTYTESLLAQQISAWKAGQSETNPETLQKQLSELQSLLVQLQARYTPDHPDVIKTKADIAEVKKKLAEVNSAAGQNTDVTGNEKSSANEPPEIRQLRMQIHQYSDLIQSGTHDQKRLQDQIALYQGRVTLSPTVEEQYKALARDYDNAQKNYQDLLASKSKADLTRKMTDQQQGETMRELNAASLPDAPSFPNRLFFLGGGLGAGLAMGVGIALWLELRDKSIRTEADAEAALDLPMLVAVPWVGEAAEAGNSYGGVGRYFRRKPDVPKEPVRV